MSGDFAGQLIGPPDSMVMTSAADGGLLLLHASDPRVLVLNDTAQAVWTLCDGTRSFPQLVAELATTYGVAVDEIEQQVRDTLAQLVTEGFLPGPGE